MISKIQFFVILSLFVSLLGCAKVDDFRRPQLMETFMGGQLTSTSVRGLIADTLVPGAVSLVGDGSGEIVYVYGLTGSEALSLVPDSLIRTSKKLDREPPPTVSGFKTEVVDETTLNVIDFGDTNDSAKELEPEVHGELIRDGKKLVGEIQISVLVGPYREWIDKKFLDSIGLTADETPVSKLDYESRYNILRFEIDMDVISIF